MKWTDCHQHMVQEAKEKTVHMEDTWRLESTCIKQKITTGIKLYLNNFDIKYSFRHYNAM